MIKFVGYLRYYGTDIWVSSVPKPKTHGDIWEPLQQETLGWILGIGLFLLWVTHTAVGLSHLQWVPEAPAPSDGCPAHRSHRHALAADVPQFHTGKCFLQQDRKSVVAHMEWEPNQLARGVGSSAHCWPGRALAREAVSEAQLTLLHLPAMAQKAYAKGCNQLGWCSVQFCHTERGSREGALGEWLVEVVAGGSWLISLLPMAQKPLWLLPWQL